MPDWLQSECSRYRLEYLQFNQELIDAQNVKIGIEAEFSNAQWMVSMAWCLMWCSLGSTGPPLWVRKKHGILKIRKTCKTPNGSTKNACCQAQVF